MSRSVVAALALCAVALVPRVARAQVGATTDIITGTIIGADSQPVADAVVEAFSLETQVTRRAQTDTHGRYTILFPDGGGQYRMTVRVVGMAPRQAIVMRQSDEDRLLWNVSMAQNPVTLTTITVRGARAPSGIERPTPGENERSLSPDQMARLPVDATDMAALAALAPGVIPIDATDTTATAFSVAGLGADANAVTLDGLLYGANSVPQDAVRQTRVITSTYDVARGQFSGGLVASTTRSGTNVVQGSSNYQLRDEALSIGDDTSAFSQAYNQNTISGGIGGPMKHDKLFAFVAGQVRLRSDPQQTLLSATPTDFTRLGVAPDSVAEFTGDLSNLGVPAGIVAAAQTRASNNLSALGRVDYNLSDAHTLMLRFDWHGATQDPSRLGPLAVPSTGGDVTNGGGGIMLSLSSRFGISIINQLMSYWQAARNDGDPLIALPQGRVEIASELPDSSIGVSTLTFGGNTGLPSSSRTSGLEITDELSFIPGSGGHRFKFGALFDADRATNLLGADRLGTFTYTSLASLAAGQPAMFTRTLQDQSRVSLTNQLDFYAGDVWMVSRPFQLTYGARVESSSFGDPPEYNPTVDSVFGRRTDQLPHEWHVSPRAGFTWTIGGRGRPAPGQGFAPGQAFRTPTLIIRGGVGEFRNPPSSALVAQARAATGLANSAAEIQCIGAAVPTPDWSAYRADTSNIPDACLSTGGGGGFNAAAAPRTVLLFGDNFQAPRAWRASLGFDKSIAQLTRLTLDMSYARGVAQTGYTDLNLAATPRFTLANEGNRPVYVNPGDIVTYSGAPLFSASRVDSTFGRVLEASSNLENETEQVTLGVNGIVGHGIIVQTSYTWQHSRAQESGVRGGNTAGDPNVIEWAPNGIQREHNILLTVTYPLGPALEVTTIGRLLSGSPYTPMVAGDVNGDGSWNDRAFIFAPGTSTPTAQAMQQLLAGASGRVRDCLISQENAVAARNSCTGPWQGTLDLQLNWRPAWWGLNRKLMISVVTVNLLHGVDELLHSPANEKGWGLTPRPDGTLLYITGFDSTTNSYQYEVNQRFGATNGSANAFRPPFQIGIQMRLTIGPDRMREALDRMRGGGRFGGGAGGGGAFGTPSALMARLEAMAPNPARIALDLKDSILLDSAQVVRLTVIRDSLDARNQARIDTLSRVITREGSNADPARLFTILRPTFEALRADIARQDDLVRGILTPVQWARVAVKLRPAAGFGPRQGGPPGGGRPF